METRMYVYWLAFVAALGGLLFGYDTAVISGAIGFLVKRFELTPMWEGWAASCALLGCVVGASCAGLLSDRFGRKRVLIFSALLFTVSAVGTALPRTLTEFILARFIGGVGVGVVSLLSPMYIAEVSPPRIRGRLVTLNQFAIIGGMLVVYLVNARVASLGEEAWNVAVGWRWMFGSETLPAILFLLLLFFVPESPRWLVKQDRQPEAHRLLALMHGEEEADAEMREIQTTVSHESGSISELFQPGLRVALLIGVGLAVLQQVTGINVVLYYAPRIFESAGVIATDAINDTIIVGIVNLSFTVIAYWTVDRFGRKPLLVIASAGMGISLVLLGIAFLLSVPGRRVWFELLGLTFGIASNETGVVVDIVGFSFVIEQLNTFILLFILTYVASFAVAMGPVVWVVVSEIFPTHIRGRAMSVAVVCLWISCFLVSQFFPFMLENLQGSAFFVYAFMCAVCFFFVLVLLPETKGKTLEEIEQSWSWSRSAATSAEPE